MNKRIRSLLAVLLSFSLAAAGNGAVFAENPEAGEPVVAASKEGTELLKESKKAQIDDYTVEVSSLEYRFGDVFYGSTYKGYKSSNSPFKVYKDGKEVTDYVLEVDSVIYKGETYDSDAYIDPFDDGLKPGETIDLKVNLTVGSPVSSGTQTYSETIIGYVTLKDVPITKKKITGEDLSTDKDFYRGYDLNRSLQINRFEYYGNIKIRLTENGKKKVGDFSSADEYELIGGEDFNIFFIGYDPYEDKEIDISEYYETDIDGCILTFCIEDRYRLCSEIDEIQSGRTPDQFRDILKKHVFLSLNDKRQVWDSSTMKIDSISVWDKELGDYKEYNDDKSLGDALDSEEKTFEIEVSTYVKNKKGENTEVNGWVELDQYKNSYNIYLDEFDEVASATGASYDRTEHDIMVNAYAIKNETEKIRIGSLGKGEMFRLWVSGEDGYLSRKESGEYFSKIRPGDIIDEYSEDGHELKYVWCIPDETRYEGIARYDQDIRMKFFEFNGKEPEKDPAKDPSNPYSDIHKSDGTDAPPLSSDSAPYTFDEEKSETLVGGVKVNIKKKFEGHVSANGYIESAKHRYVLDKECKKLAKIDKKGNITPKKSGKIKIWLEQKNGKKWEKIGDPVELYIQVPKMLKKTNAKVGEKLQGRTLISGTTFTPNSWKVSKRKVADIDPVTGEIKFNRKGTVVVTAIYGDENCRSKKKIKTKIKVKKAS